MPESRGAQASARLRAAAERLLAEVDRLPPDLIIWQPAPDVWSVIEILGHVEEFIAYWTTQTVHIVEHPDQLWGRDHTNRDRLTAVEKAATRQLADVQRGIRQAVTESSAVLSRLTDAELDVEATSRNPRWGHKPAHFVVEQLLVQHVEKHIGQVSRNLTQYQQKDSETTS